MQDIIEGDDIPLWRLCAIALQAAAILVIAMLTSRCSTHGNLSIAL